MRPMSGIYTDERLGGVLKTVDGTKASYRLNGSELFVQAVVPAMLESSFDRRWANPALGMDSTGWLGRRASAGKSDFHFFKTQI